MFALFELKSPQNDSWYYSGSTKMQQTRNLAKKYKQT